MSFKAQRLVNKFPGWSKTRQDPSSMGYRLLSVFADYYDFISAELLKIKEYRDLLKDGLGPPFLYSIQLDEDDKLTPTTLIGGGVDWTYPTLVEGDAYSLTRVTSLEELFFNVPSRITAVDSTAISNFLIYSSSTPFTYATMDTDARLTIVVENSSEYARTATTSNRFASNAYFIFLEGKDINDIKITEQIEITDDGVYRTKNIFREITDVNRDGFNGDINIYSYTATDYITDRYHVGVNEDIEGPLEIHPSTFEYSATTYSIVSYITNLIKLGTSYRTGTLPDFDNNVLLWEQHLLNDAAATYDLVDIAINPNSTRLYSLDTAGNIHVYDHSPSSFIGPVDQADLTLDSYIEVQPLKPWARMGETMDLFTWFREPKYAVAGVTVYRIDPNGVKEYLQSVNPSVWAAGVFEFVTTSPETKLPEKSWQDIKFTTDFTILGQWEFYVIANTVVDNTTSYTGVMVDTLTALTTIATGVATPTSIHFDHDDYLVVTEAANAYRFKLNSDVYLADPEAQQLFFIEDYTSVEVTP